jgi:hypothetical protein
MTIPKEYLDSTFDFGFTTSDDGLPPLVTPSVQPSDISEPIIQRIEVIEEHLLDITETLNRIETASADFDTTAYKALIEKDVKAKLASVEKLIMPLLVNLLKNPEKDTIKWPNRAPIIQSQIDKIIAITRS